MLIYISEDILIEDQVSEVATTLYFKFPLP